MRDCAKNRVYTTIFTRPGTARRRSNFSCFSRERAGVPFCGFRRTTLTRSVATALNACTVRFATGGVGTLEPRSSAIKVSCSCFSVPAAGRHFHFYPSPHKASSVRETQATRSRFLPKFTMERSNFSSKTFITACRRSTGKQCFYNNNKKALTHVKQTFCSITLPSLFIFRLSIHCCFCLYHRRENDRILRPGIRKKAYAPERHSGCNSILVHLVPETTHKS